MSRSDGSEALMILSAVFTMRCRVLRLDALQGLAVGCCAASEPHRDVAAEDALDGASVEGEHDGGGKLLLSSVCGRSRGAAQ